MRKSFKISPKLKKIQLKKALLFTQTVTENLGNFDVRVYNSQLEIILYGRSPGDFKVGVLTTCKEYCEDNPSRNMNVSFFSPWHLPNILLLFVLNSSYTLVVTVVAN